MYAAGALRARVYLVLQGAGGQLLTGMGLNWCYQIRRRVAWNGSVYPGNASLCAVVCLDVRVSWASAAED